MQKFKSFSIHDYEVDDKFSLDARTLKKYGLLDLEPECTPYSGPIKMVKEVSKVRTPFQKIKCLEAITQQVEFTIKKFYEDHHIDEPIALDADNAISILLYILVQSEQSQLLAQINAIEHFINKDAVSGGLGYCLATIRACL